MIITYFKSLHFPLSEATRIQFFNFQTKNLKIAFVRTLKPYRKFNDCVIFSLYILPLLFPYLCIKSLFAGLQIYGPADSRLLNFLYKCTKSQRLFTDAADYLEENSEYNFSPVMDLSLVEKPDRKTSCDDCLRLLFMSHASEFKGFYDIVRLCNVLSDIPIHLRICFSKPVDEFVIEFLQRELDGVVKLEILGVVDYKEQLKWAHVYYYVYWRERWTFIVPLSLLEAIMMGCLPIGPKLSSVQKWIHQKFLVEPHDLEQSVTVLRHFYKEENYYLKIIQKNREYLLANCKWVETRRC